MSFSWANQFAKSALRTAQKHIDSVLDIQEEEEDDDDKESAANTTAASSSNEITEEGNSNSDPKYEIENPKTEPKRQKSTDKMGSSRYVDVELSVNTSLSPDWSATNYEEKITPVVDAEPNPIRDADEDALTPLNYSPSDTNTPEEDPSERVVNEEDGQQDANLTHLSFNDCENKRSNSISLQSIRSGESRRMAMEEANPEEAHTIASSDIEVVKHLDDWSVSSGNHWRNDEPVIPSGSLPHDDELVSSLMATTSTDFLGGTEHLSSGKPTNDEPNDVILSKTSNAMKSGDIHSKTSVIELQESGESNVIEAAYLSPEVYDAAAKEIHALKELNERLRERVVVLDAKLRHKDQQMEEVTKANEKLRVSNANLAAKNKQISAKSTTEAKLQKQLADKEKELNDLMEEGKRLSEHCGKQAREIRKLKQHNAQLEAVEAARDSALAELQSAHSAVNDHLREVEELREKLKDSEAMLAQVRKESELNRVSTDIVDKFMAEKNAEFERINAELKRCKEDLKIAVREKIKLTEEQQTLRLKLLNKRAQDYAESDRERGDYEDLVAERARTAELAAQIRQLEAKNEMLLNAQHDIAAQISEANFPLLNNISALEEKICVLERQNETLAAQLHAANDAVNRQRRDAEAQYRQLVQRLEDEQNESLGRARELERVISENSSLLNEIEKVRDELRVQSAENARCRCEADEKHARLETELRAKQLSYENLERQYSDFLKSSMRFAANEDGVEMTQTQSFSSASRSSAFSEWTPQLTTTATRLDNLLEEEEENETAPEDEMSGANSKIGRPLLSGVGVDVVDCENEEFVGRAAIALTNEPDGVMLNADETPSSPWSKHSNTKKSSFHELTFGGAASRNKIMSFAGAISTPASTSTQSAASVEFFRHELEDAQEQLFQLRDKFDRLLELYGGCLEQIDELKYDNEDLRKLCKEQALELSSLKSK